ncbi:hypothetical protein ACH4TE_35345 [Streptomyces sioyaensis]|uniref:hypothetical protein n=1 Tax=Streptomyces sioyaensis TaxID=67364 RepID=UPI00378E79B2
MQQPSAGPASEYRAKEFRFGFIVLTEVGTRSESSSDLLNSTGGGIRISQLRDIGRVDGLNLALILLQMPELMPKDDELVLRCGVLLAQHQVLVLAGYP